MKLSVIVPAHNEAGCLESTLHLLDATLTRHQIEHEILVVNDYSTDETESVTMRLLDQIPSLRLINNAAPQGFGFAVREGLQHFTGGAAAIFMADASDSPEDLAVFFRTLLEKKVDCVFGSRFIKGGRAVGYPVIKLLVNRAANTVLQVLFGIRYNDMTNAFKLYRRETLEAIRPFRGKHFNLSVELCLNAIIKGRSYRIVPNTWSERAAGQSKFFLLEVGPLYLWTVLCCFVEKWRPKSSPHCSSDRPSIF